jgi:branched-subunit amino acid aminotransferase/4-amino-4-deoxychorismate lyase
MEPYIYLNGMVMPVSDAKISPLDRGFLYGDGLFETMRSYGGGIHLLQRHLVRLQNGCSFLGIGLPPDSELIDALRAVVSANGAGDMVLRLTVTRGTGGSALDSSASDEPLILIVPRPTPTRDDQPERMITLNVRKVRSGFGVTLKSLNYLPVVVAAKELQAAGVREGVMLTEDNWVAEGTVSNIFSLLDGELFTPPLDLGVLPGITRNRVMELAKGEGIVVHEERFTAEELGMSDECFYTSSVREIVPVNKLDERQIGNGMTGPVTRRLQALYCAETPGELL